MVFSKSYKTNKIYIGSDKSGTQCFDQLPLSWYPVITSRALKKGQKRVINFLDKDWLIFRNSSGEVGIVSRYCSHMGTDLTNGHVDSKHIICPLHHWCFDTHGGCHSPIEQPYLKQAKLPSLATEERAGVIFIFPKATALYALPKLHSNDVSTMSSTAILNLPIHYNLVGMNTFDTMHYKSIHNRQLEKTHIYADNIYHLGIEFSAEVLLKKWQDRLMHILGLGSVNISIDCWGGTILDMYNSKAKLGAYLAIAPINKFTSRLYITAYDTSAKPHLIAKPFNRIKLELSRMMTTAYLKADIPICQGTQPVEGVLIPGQDDATKQFWQYYKQLPKIKTTNED
jgi:nitrite reductase/ring-hydroxylating ferredoxin subunit